MLKLVLAFCLLLLPVVAHGQLAVSRDPVVQPCWTPDLTCLQITFWTNQPAVATVGYGPNPLATGGTLWTPNTTGVEETNTVNGGFRHRHTLTVNPGQDIQYEVWLNGAIARRSNGEDQRYSLTIPGGSDNRCYTVMADWAVGGGEPFNTWRNNVMIDWGCLGLVTAGDNGYWYPTNEWAKIDQGFFRPWNSTDLIKKPWLAENVIMIGLGNHDNSAEFKSVFPGTYRYHDDPLTIIHQTTCGGCGNATTANNLRNWIREGKARGNVVVVVVHYPVYPCMYREQANLLMQQYWKPVFEQEGVSLVIQGHEHGLAVSKPHGGVYYITTGGASDGSGRAKDGFCTATGNQPIGYPAYTRPLSAIKQISRLSIEGQKVIWEAFLTSGAPISGTRLEFTGTGTIPPPPVPTLTISTGMSWASTDATQCTKSGSWSGAAPTTGSEVVGPGTYTLTCTGPGGSATQTRTITAP